MSVSRPCPQVDIVRFPCRGSGFAQRASQVVNCGITERCLTLVLVDKRVAQSAGFPWRMLLPGFPAFLTVETRIRTRCQLEFIVYMNVLSEPAFHDLFGRLPGRLV